MSAVLTPVSLQRYCATEGDTREHLRKPFRAGGWVYATNGHICVRVPDDESIEAVTLAADQRITQKAPALFDKWLTDVAYEAMPDLPLVDRCLVCSGARFHWAHRCEGCTDGEFERRGFTYSCRECDDEPVEAGWIKRYVADDRDETDVQKECRACQGRGFSEGRVELNGIPFELGYVHWAADLPGARIKTHAKEDPVAIRFDGGEALLMPLRY